MSIDGAAAAQTLLSFRDIRGGYCLHYVWQAYKAHGASTGRNAPTALVGWERSDGKHPDDWNPPAGVPVWFGARPGSDAGDVVISLGGGRVAATDYPVYGVVGSCTIAERQRQIGRPYLGWTERIFDVRISTPGSASSGATPISTEELDMDEGRLKDLVKLAITELRGNDGRNLLDSVIQTRSELRDRAKEGASDALVSTRGNDGRNVLDGVIQTRYDIADVAARVNAGGVDPKALAEAIDDAGLARDVADELARRMQG